MAEDALIGRVLPGQIEIKRQIGVGGMGAVYEGFQEHLGRRVAIKVMTKEHAENPIAADYFLREARAASKLRHPNIIQIIDFGQADELTYMAMEYIPGKPLSDVVADEFPLEPKRIADILDQALSALSVAHEQLVIHRDLKPDNLMVEQVNRRDFVKVLDFGIAQSKAPNRTQGPLTQQGAVVGTPQYMAPEQAMGDRVDGRSDIFSLGVILYEMLSQEVPFRGKSLPEVLIKVIKHHPPPPSAIRSDLTIDPTLEAICLRALKKEPELRYQNAAEFREALSPLLGGASKLSPAQKKAPATFIFKRNKDEAKPDEHKSAAPKLIPQLAAEQTAPSTKIAHPEEMGVPSEAEEHSVATAKTPAPWAIDQGLGIDISELKEDLVGERRHVVVLVAHQRTYDRLSAEQLAEALEAFDGVFRSVCEKWGGVVQGRQGSFHTLVFGFPKPKTDDAFRAIQAGLQLRIALRKAAPEQMKFAFAVSQGEVFCPRGEIERAAGAPIDDASECVRSAGDDDLRITGDEFHTALESMFRMSAEATDGSYGIIGIVNAAMAPEGDDLTALVGRDEHIATMLGLLGRLVRGQGNLTVIDGGPGIGKSALIAETVDLARQRDTTVLRARHRFAGDIGVRDVVRQLLMDFLRQRATSGMDPMSIFITLGVPSEYARVLAAVAEDDLRDALGFIGSAISVPTEVNGSKIVDVSFRAFLQTASSTRPVVIFLDEIAEYDDVIEDLIFSWSRFAKEFPVMFTMGLRTDGSFDYPRFPSDGTIIHLEPISEVAARALLRNELKGGASKDLIEKFTRIAAGVPLNLVQLILYAKAKRTLTLDEANEWLADAGDVRSIIEQRLFDQPPSVRNVLALLSALGHEVETSRVVALSSSSWEPEASLQAAYEQGILEVVDYESDDPTVRFGSPAFREVVYRQLSSKARQKIHGKVATYYAERVQAAGEEPSQSDLANLVEHLCATEQFQQGFHHLLHLIDRALKACDYKIAIQHINHAVRLVRDNAAGSIEDEARLCLKRVRANEAIGLLKVALDEVRGLERIGEISEKLRLEIRLELIRLWLLEEDPDLVERVVKKALQEIRLLDGQMQTEETAVMLIRVLQLMTEVQEKQGRLPHASQSALEAIDIAERRKISPEKNNYGPSVVWAPLNQLGRIRIRSGEYDSAARMFELALRVTDKCNDQRGDMQIRGNIAALLQAQDRLDAAYRTVQRALKTARQVSDLRAVAKLEHNRALLLIRQRRMEMAKQAFETSQTICEELDWREGIAMNVTRMEQHFNAASSSSYFE